MRKICSVIIVAILISMLGLTAFASEKTGNGVAITVVMPEMEEQYEPKPSNNIPNLYPVSVSETRKNDRREIIRVYELADNENPDHIPREPFEREGFMYKLAEITRSEMLSFDSREQVETVSVNSANNDLESVLKLLSQTFEYQSEDGYAGNLTLDVSTIAIESAGTRTNTSTASRTREYPHFSNNDTSLVPKTITDGGTTFHLSNVDWRAGNMEAINYTQLPQTYTAIATYTASVSRTSVVGYNTTAEYKGVISKTSQGRMRYTANFIGIPIVAPVITQVIEAQSPAADAEAPVVDGDTAICEEYANPQSELTLPDDIEPEMRENADSNDEQEGEKQPLRFSPITVLTLIAVAAVISYVIGKYGKKAIDKFRKPLCLMITVVMLSNLSHTAFASNLSQLPDYGFGSRNAENTVFFDTYSANGHSSQLNMVGSLQVDQFGTGYVPHIYDDGEFIGKLTVDKLGKTINIYEGESLASMNKGGGRFSFTGMNSGNTAIIGHNRGRTNGFFIFVKDLQQGDILTLEMGGVTKKYAVTYMYAVNETDFSPLMQFGNNRLTLVTCLENRRNMRRIAVCSEI